MAVKIRLKRMGKKKQPFYRIVVADSRAPRDGRSIEKLGHYNPIKDPAELVINEERLFHWLDQGAQASDTVFSLLRGEGLTLKYELKRRNADEATISKEISILKLLSPVKTYSNYTYVHSINVAVLSIFQAEALGIRGRLLHDVGLAALLQFLRPPLHLARQLLLAISSRRVASTRSLRVARPTSPSYSARCAPRCNL